MTYTLKIKAKNATTNAILKMIEELPFFELEKKEKDIYLPKNLDELIAKGTKEFESGETLDIKAENLWDYIK